MGQSHMVIEIKAARDSIVSKRPPRPFDPKKTRYDSHRKVNADGNANGRIAPKIFDALTKSMLS